jgi:arylsulfatase A-like enzyme
LKRALGTLLLALAACDPGPKPPPATPAAAPSSAGTRRNVLLITIDTLRADHLGAYGYARPTSPRIDAFAKRAVVFDQAYTYWPKTRGSFVAMMSGRRDSQTGYGKSHPLLLDFNPTLAEALKKAGYRTAATVDNANVAAQHGYARGFDRYRETWLEEENLPTEMDKTRAITGDGLAFLESASSEQPFFLWLHYVNPHAPYTPPPPYDTMFLKDGAGQQGERLRVVDGFVGGVSKQWAVPGQDRLGYYVAQYDGEIAAVDQEVGKVLDALDRSPHAAQTLVVITSDHGESLGEHGYYFDHGQDLHDPCLRIPLLVAEPGVPGGTRSTELATTLDLVPTVLDAVKVSYPPDLAGTSLLPALRGRPLGRERLFARNDRNLTAGFDARLKVIATPTDTDLQYQLFDRAADPQETKDVARTKPDDMRVARRELELFLARSEREWSHTRGLLSDKPGEAANSPAACEQLKAWGYGKGAGCK